MVVDVTPLRRDPAFRQLWVGQIGSGLARESARIALPLHVYLLTESAAMLGVLALAQLLPSLVFSLGGGALADAFDRRRLMIAAQVGMGLTTVVLLATALLPDPPTAVIVLCAALLSTCFAVEHPARTSAVPRLVPAERLSAAISITSLNFQLSALIGPAVAGILIATTDVAAAYGLQLLAYGWAIGMTLRVPSIAPIGKVARPSLGGILDGLKFIRRRRIILSAVIIDLNAMIFGLPIAIFPVLALEIFGLGAAEVGFLAAARGAGALAAAFLSGWVNHLRRLGRAVVFCVLVYGLITIVLGQPGIPFVLAIGLVAIAGAADLLSAVLRNTIIQSVTTDELRGRVSAAHGLATQSGPRIGDLRAALMTETLGASPAIAIGGVVATLGVGVIGRFFPELWRYDHKPHAGAKAGNP